MLGIFKINDPYRLIIVLFFLLIVFMPVYLSELRIEIPEIEWQTIGEKLDSGGVMYVDVYHPTGLLAATIYQILSFISNGNYVLYRILAMILIFIQAVFFNVILIRHKAFNQNTYVPAAIYAVIMISVADFSTLSPQLMSLIFVLFAFDLTFRHIEGRRKRDWIVLRIGFYLGISFLFYSLNYLLLISTIFGFLFYTNTMFRRYLLLMIGFLLPVLLVWAKYFWFDQQIDFYFNLKYLIYPFQEYNLASWRTLIILMIVPIIYVVFSFLKVFSTTAFINYQVRLQYFMIIMFLIGLLMIPFDYYQATHVMVFLVPPMAFFITHYFLLLKKRWLAELLFMILIGLAVTQNYLVSFSLFYHEEWMNLQKQYYSKSEVDMSQVKDKKILLLGNHNGEYYNHKLATPYLSWLMAKEHFLNLDKYPVIIRVYEKITQDEPGVIIDKADLTETLFEKIPLLKDQYKKTSGEFFIHN